MWNGKVLALWKTDNNYPQNNNKKKNNVRSHLGPVFESKKLHFVLDFKRLLIFDLRPQVYFWHKTSRTERLYIWVGNLFTADR